MRTPRYVEPITAAHMIHTGVVRRGSRNERSSSNSGGNISFRKPVSATNAKGVDTATNDSKNHVCRRVLSTTEGYRYFFLPAEVRRKTPLMPKSTCGELDVPIFVLWSTTLRTPKRTAR